MFRRVGGDFRVDASFDGRRRFFDRFISVGDVRRDRVSRRRKFEKIETLERVAGGKSRGARERRRVAFQTD